MTVSAADPPPLPADLQRIAAVACIRIADDGTVHDAFLIGTTGDAWRDLELVGWIRQMHWPPAKPGETLRNVWFPMPVAIGGAPPLDPPARCGPA